jgi:hypothetical protein
MSVALDERFGSKKPDYKLEMKAFRGPISLKRDFRFTPKSSHPADELACPFSARSGLMHRGKKDRYSITSSARSSTVDGTVKPSALAVWRLRIV